MGIVHQILKATFDKTQEIMPVHGFHPSPSPEEFDEIEVGELIGMEATRRAFYCSRCNTLTPESSKCKFCK